MKNKTLLLLKTLLSSTSIINSMKNSENEKKKSRLTGNLVGMSILMIVLVCYSISLCMVYGKLGAIEAVPVISALTVSALAFIFTVIKTNGYLFAFKEYDMLMSMPFEVSTIVRAKFLYMYVKSLPWYLSISLSMMIGYGIFEKPAIPVYLIWLVLSFALPLIPMIIAAFIGFLIAKVGLRFKKTKIAQVVFTFAIILLAFCSGNLSESFFRDSSSQIALMGYSNQAAGYYFPAKWFSTAVLSFNVVDFVLLLGLSIMLTELVLRLVSRSYRRINSGLKTSAEHKKFNMGERKVRSMVKSIAFKELKTMLGSTTYLVNVLMGHLLALILGVGSLIVGMDKIISVITKGAPVTREMLIVAIPIIVYLLVCMMASTVCSPSLEGKNMWIIKSLPIEGKTVYQGKILFNLLLAVPVVIVSTVCLGIASGADMIDIFLFLILGIILCCFSSCWGCVCGIKHINLEWENDIEVVKQGAAVLVYLFPNMIGSMVLVVGAVALGMIIPPKVITLALIVIMGIVAYAAYRKAMSLAELA